MNAAIDNAIWHQMTLVPMTLHEPKSHNASHVNYLILGNAKVPFMQPSELCDADTGTNGINDQESHVAPHFNCRDLWNAMLALLILFTLYDGGGRGVTWLKDACCITFPLSLTKENSDAIYGDVSIMWYWSKWLHVRPKTVASYDTNASGNCVIWPKKPCYKFDCLDLKNLMVTLRMLIASWC